MGVESEAARQLAQLRSKGRRDSASWARSRWHADGAERFPPPSAFDPDLPHLIRTWITPGHAPPAGALSTEDRVITIGSCFARELRRYLREAGFESETFWVPSGLNNTFAILDFVSWCVTGQETGRGFRYDQTEEGTIHEWKPEAERERYVRGLREAGAFVFTLGLAEVWQDRETGAVFWRGVPQEIFEAERHVFRLSTVEENEANLVKIVELVRSLNPSAPIVLTLSPVPLAATFRGMSCLTADCVSKSVLRVALDRTMTRQLPGVYYWPSFEIVRWLGAHVPWSMYGVDDSNPRHVSKYLVGKIIDTFIEAFYTPAAAAELEERGRQFGSPPWSLAGRLHLTSPRKAMRRASHRARLARNRLKRRSAAAGLAVLRHRRAPSPRGN